MKTVWCFAIIMATACVGVTAQTPAPTALAAPTYANAHEAQLHNDWAGLKHFQAADAALPAPSPNRPRVVFMGDSITAGWGTHGDITQYFPGKDYINRGISGQTTPQMLVRFTQDVIDLHPQVVAILGGINDIAENTGPMRIQDTEANIAAMSDLAHAHGIAVVLCSIMPAKAFPWHPGIDPIPSVTAIDAWMRPYAAAHGDAYVDYYTALNDGAGGMRASLTRDGVHPTPAGYAVMTPLVQAGINTALANATATIK